MMADSPRMSWWERLFAHVSEEPVPLTPPEERRRREAAARRVRRAVDAIVMAEVELFERGSEPENHAR